MTNDSFHKMEYAQVEGGDVFLGWWVRRRFIERDEEVTAIKVRRVPVVSLGGFSATDLVLAVSTAKPCDVEFPRG